MILIALGSSLSFCSLSPHATVAAAIRAVDAFAPVVATSRFYHSPAYPHPDDPPFVNAVIEVHCDPDPEGLLSRLHEVEAAFGRRRGVRNAPRTLDLDLLAIGTTVRTAKDGRPVLPHPRLAERDFVLAPLCDIAPGWRHPVTGRTAREMLTALPSVGAIPLAG